jgi:5'-nucleotidase
MVASAMWLRQGIQTDFALTNTTGIRADLVPGPVTIEEMYNVFPFDNSVSKMNVSGVEVQKLFDFVARRSASRGCVSQAQIAGARVVLNCNACTRADLVGPCTQDTDCPEGSSCGDDKHCVAVPCAEQIYIGRYEDRPCVSDSECGGTIGSCDDARPDANQKGRCLKPIDPIASYELATSNYLATGGSGYRVLRANTTQFDTGVQQRDALTDFVRQGRPCGFNKANNTPDGLQACKVDADCGDATRVCACVGHVVPQSNGTCESSTGSCGDAGRCVLRRCRDDVAAFHRRTCEGGRTDAARQSCEDQINPCELGGEECKFLACIDEHIGNYSDNRLLMVGK